MGALTQLAYGQQDVATSARKPPTTLESRLQNKKPKALQDLISPKKIVLFSNKCYRRLLLYNFIDEFTLKTGICYYFQ